MRHNYYFYKHFTRVLLLFLQMCFFFLLCMWWIFSPACPSWWSYKQTSSLCAWPLTSSWQPSSHSCPETEDTLSICCPGPFDRKKKYFTKKKENHTHYIWIIKSSKTLTHKLQHSQRVRRRRPSPRCTALSQHAPNKYQKTKLDEPHWDGEMNQIH